MKTMRVVRLWMRMSFAAAPWSTSILVVGTVITATLGPAVAVVVARAAGALSSGEPITTHLIVIGILLAAAGLQQAISSVLDRSVEEKARLHVRATLIDVIASIPSLAHHEHPKIADRIELISRDAEKLAGAYRLLAILGGLAVFATTLVLLGSIHPAFTLLIAVLALPILTDTRGEMALQGLWEFNERYRRLGYKLATAMRTPAFGVEMRSFGALQPVLSVARRSFVLRRRVWTQVSIRQGASTAVAWLVVGVAFALALTWLAGRVETGAASIEQLVLFVGLLSTIALSVRSIGDGVAVVSESLNAVSRLEWLQDYAATHRWEGTERPPADLTDGVTFEGVSFHYPSAEDEPAPPASLTKVSLHFPAGTTVALVGENGAGKSTLVKLLARLYDPTSGRILIDGVPLASIDPTAWRSRLSAGFQDFARFEFAARDSVGVGNLDRCQEPGRVAEAVRQGEAQAVIDRLPHGLETQLGAQFSDGVDLSGGQWQRVALARAHMRDRPLLLLLDEPTSALDPEAEQAIFDRYAAAREHGKRTGAVTLVVSHRFSTVRQADTIVVVGDGRIQEQGTHEELMAAGARYAELFAAQSKFYE